MPNADTDDNENLKLFYRTMTTEQLITYRNALGLDLQGADTLRARGWRATREFAKHRRQLLAEVLAERGVEALT